MLNANCFRLFFAAVLSIFAYTSNAEILATGQLLSPLIPDGDSHLSILVPPKVDRGQSVWVVYQLVAVSADADPEGKIIVDSSFESVPVPLADSIVTFDASDLDVDKSAGKLGEQLRATVGERSDEELQEIYGTEMYTAFKALSKNEGSFVTGNIIKTYQLNDTPVLTLLVSVERATGIQPLMLSATVGQGEIPAKLAGSSVEKDKLVATIIAFVAAILFWYSRRKKS